MDFVVQVLGQYLCFLNPEFFDNTNVNNAYKTSEADADQLWGKLQATTRFGGRKSDVTGGLSFFWDRMHL
jgi:hypothetical protein